MTPERGTPQPLAEATRSADKPEATPPSADKPRRRKTSHLKAVPETREMRDRLRQRCREVTRELDKRVPLTKDEMERVARELLEREGLAESLVGWTMVNLASAFWEDQVAGVPPERRLFLLPHCLKHAEGCPADYDEFGLDCKQCGACSIADFRTTAEEMGYKVLVAEGSPIVLKIIVSGYVDAIVGVACLNVLEKAIDKILLAGIPCMAVPLLSSDCRNTSVDEAWVTEMIQLSGEPAEQETRSYVHLMRAAAQMFAPDELDRLVPRVRASSGSTKSLGSSDGLSGLDPIAATEAIAYDFLAKGGKHARPFITLAVWDALSGGNCTGGQGATEVAAISDAVRRCAMSIEVFHKASLVHDDIEDDDAYRYGDPTLHRTFGTATAINVGDFLIGLGYRLVSRESAALGADVVADLLRCLSEAHMKLSEGQGAELVWRDSRDKQLKPIDALKIYALKTSPAFEAALYMGACLAGRADTLAEPLKLFARNLGVAFQILNDLKDWDGDLDNKRIIGGDLLGGRPTVLWALALEGLHPEQRQELLDIAAFSDSGGGDAPDHGIHPSHRLHRARELFISAGVLDTARRLVEKHRQRALQIAADVPSPELQRLLNYLIDTVLEPETAPVTPVVATLVPTDTSVPTS